MKDRLKSLYQSQLVAISAVKEAFPGADMPGPLLMSPSPLYEIQSHRLLIIGQDTHGWTYHHTDIDCQLATYEDFNVGEDYHSPFWNITRKLEKALGNTSHSCAWTNLNKYDVEERRPTGQHEQVIAQLDPLLLEEIAILQPHVCMFYTGPYFDQRLQKLFPGLEYIPIPGWKPREFCQLRHSQLPAHTYRSYHPRALRQYYLEERFIAYFTTVAHPPQA